MTLQCLLLLRFLLHAAAADAQGRPSGHLRCMRISTDGRHICVGDQAGTLRVYDSVTLKLLVQQEAHDCEVLCLDYSPVMQGGSCLAASGSRDTLIHVYDAQAGYALLQTLDEHSAAVTGVRFTAGGKGLVSCGADRSIIFRCARAVVATAWAVRKLGSCTGCIQCTCPWIMLPASTQHIAPACNLPRLT
jgi:hypothetical protein